MSDMGVPRSSSGCTSEGLSALETVAAPALDELGKSNRRSALTASTTSVDELIELTPEPPRGAKLTAA